MNLAAFLAGAKVLFDKFENMSSTQAVILVLVGYLLFNKAGVTVREFLDSISANPEIIVTVSAAESNVLARISALESNLLEVVKKENAQ